MRAPSAGKRILDDLKLNKNLWSPSPRLEREVKDSRLSSHDNTVGYLKEIKPMLYLCDFHHFTSPVPVQLLKNGVFLHGVTLFVLCSIPPENVVQGDH